MTPKASAQNETQLGNYTNMDEPANRSVNQSQAGERMDLEMNALDQNQADKNIYLELQVNPAVHNINTSTTEAFLTASQDTMDKNIKPNVPTQINMEVSASRAVEQRQTSKDLEVLTQKEQQIIQVIKNDDNPHQL